MLDYVQFSQSAVLVSLFTGRQEHGATLCWGAAPAEGAITRAAWRDLLLGQREARLVYYRTRMLADEKVPFSWLETSAPCQLSACTYLFDFTCRSILGKDSNLAR